MTISCTSLSSGANSIYNPQWLYVTQSSGPTNTPYIQSLQIPVTNTNMAIQTNVTVGAGFAGNVNIRVYGTGQVISAPVYRSDGDGFSGTIPEGGTFHQNVSTGNSGPFYVGSKNGYATLAIYNGNTSTNGYMYLQYIESGALVQFAGVLATGATPGSGPIIQAQFPMRVIVANFIQAAGGSYQATISQ